jgi:hypothetical protein
MCFEDPTQNACLEKSHIRSSTLTTSRQSFHDLVLDEILKRVYHGVSRLAVRASERNFFMNASQRDYKLSHAEVIAIKNREYQIQRHAKLAAERLAAGTLVAKPFVEKAPVAKRKCGNPRWTSGCGGVDLTIVVPTKWEVLLSKLSLTEAEAIQAPTPEVRAFVERQRFKSYVPEAAISNAGFNVYDEEGRWT